MNEVIKQWVTVLRSGKYKQIFEKLNDSGNGCCALGVLCELATEQGIVTKVVTDGNVYYDGYECSLPPAVQAWAGVSSDNPLLKINKNEERSVITMNDIEFKSFADIAECIEKTYE